MSRSGLLRYFVPAALVACGALSFSAAGCVEAEGRFYVDRTCVKTAAGFECEDFFTSSISVDYVRCSDISLSCPDSNPIFACEVIEDGGEFIRICNDGLTVGVVLINAMASSIENDGNFNTVETSKILVSGYDVRLDNGVAERIFIYNAAASVSPDYSETSISVQVLPLGDDGQEVLQEAADAGIISGFAGVRFYGRTSGGIDVETPEFFLPVTFAPL